MPGKCWPHDELFFFLIKKEPAVLPYSETFINADIRTSHFSAVLKKCALIALQVIAEEGRDGDGCPKSPLWESEGEVWSEDESVSSSGSCEGNAGNDALHVIGLYGPDGKISLFLKD